MTDPHFDRALRAAARRGRAAGPCPDAALLAAYVDRGLSPAERVAIEKHVADCASCMEHLALLGAVDLAAETPPAPGVAWSPASVLRRWGWLVPVATAALLVAIWVRLPEPQPTTSLRQAPASAGAGGARPSAPADKLAEADAGSSERQALRDEARAGGNEIAGTRPAAKKPAQAAPPSPPQAAHATPRVQDRLARRVAEPEAVVGGRPGTSGGADADDAPAAPAERRVAAAAPAAPPAAKDEGKAVAFAEAAQSATGLMKTARPPLVISAGGPVRVRAVAGRLERSTDAGVTWTTELDGTNEPLTLGHCPTSIVCWLAGGDAVYVRGPTGWVRRTVPGDVPVTGLMAEDALHATVTLADGRELSTGDGGRTWDAPVPRP
jgi:Putative zinc-finger